VFETTTRSSHSTPAKANNIVSVTFGSGDFSSTAANQTTLTSFHLDRTVDLMTNITVTQNDGGFFIGLTLRTPDGGPENVKSSEVFNAEPGTVVSIPFEGIPEGFYDIVIVSVDGTVAGSFTASWENVQNDDDS
jgi:hypothetical protein